MATNLRLSAETATALRAAAESTGRSQQDLLRDAVNRYLGLSGESDRERGVRSGLVRPPSSFVDVTPSVQLAAGVSILDLLDRDEKE
ncbi:MAG: ribbon-helix-helix protein, CopG family [Nocardioidaceae bacterium]